MDITIPYLIGVFIIGFILGFLVRQDY